MDSMNNRRISEKGDKDLIKNFKILSRYGSSFTKE